MERLCTTNIEHELRFVDWEKRNNIDFIFFDLDDTFCDTSKVYDDKIYECVNLLAGKTYDFNRVNKDFHETNNRFFETNSVNQNKMDKVIKDLRTRWDFTDDTERVAILKLGEIFTTPYQLFDGVANMLGFLNKTGSNFGIVTHANRDWTWRKYNWFGLERYLKWDDIFIVDENRHKTSLSWLAAAEYFRVNPMKSMVVGDSPRTDMCASHVGFKHLYLVGSDEKRWVVYNADLPPEVRRIPSADLVIHLGCCIQ